MILHLMEELRREAIRWSQEARCQNKPMLGLKECGETIDKMRQFHRGLRERLHKLYLETYE